MSYFPAIRMNCVCVINRPKQLLLVSFPCHNVLTHYVFSNTFGMLGFLVNLSISEDTNKVWTLRIIQICSNLETQWTAQLSWDIHYMRRNRPFLLVFNFLIIFPFIFWHTAIMFAISFLDHITKKITGNRKA